MHYKTRTYLNEAVMVKSTGCEMNEVWSMYAIFIFWSCDSQGRDLTCYNMQLCDACVCTGRHVTSACQRANQQNFEDAWFRGKIFCMGVSKSMNLRSLVLLVLYL